MNQFCSTAETWQYIATPTSREHNNQLRETKFEVARIDQSDTVYKRSARNPSNPMLS